MYAFKRGFSRLSKIFVSRIKSPLSKNKIKFSELFLDSKFNILALTNEIRLI